MRRSNSFTAMQKRVFLLRGGGGLYNRYRSPALSFGDSERVPLCVENTFDDFIDGVPFPIAVQGLHKAIQVLVIPWYG